MALKDLLALVDDKLSEVYDRVAYKPEKDRERFAKRVEATKTKFLATEPARGQKDFSVSNGVVRYSPTLKGNSVSIGSKTTLHIPSERFSDFLDKLAASVNAGELDDAIEAAASGDGEAKPVKRPRAKREGTTGGSGWSDERRAAFAATIAARKAAKEGADA